jgi:hypothetical protein
MSTYWYLECLDHDPILTSGDEVEQHTEGLDRIDIVVSSRKVLAQLGDDAARDALIDALTYFERNAFWFVIAHPQCRLRYRSEYGHYRPVIAPKGAPHV